MNKRVFYIFHGTYITPTKKKNETKRILSLLVGVMANTMDVDKRNSCKYSNIFVHKL